jgi:hypothetical protein
MIYTTKSFYSQGAAQRHSNVLFVFGDNLDRVGYGGQAIIRDMPNAIGVATKRSCSEYMTGTLDDFEAVVGDLRDIELLADIGQRDILLPMNKDGTISLGCGLAELPLRAPHLYGMIQDWFVRLPNKQEVVLINAAR